MEVELGARVSELVQVTRQDVVLAKRRILAKMVDGQPHGVAELLQHLAELDGVQPLVGLKLQIDLPDRNSLNTVVSADHPVIAALKTDVAAHEAIGELTAQGLVIGAGGPAYAPDSQPRIGYEIPGMGASFLARAPRPAPPSDVVVLPHNLRGSDVWLLEPDIFVADLATLGLDPRTERCIRESLACYRRGVFLPAASLAGAATEGAWFAAAHRLRGRSTQLDRLAESDRTAQLQMQVAVVIRESPLQKGRKWEADELAQFAGLMRRIRNYGVHPRDIADEGLEIYFEEARCGLLLLETHRHLKRLAELVAGIAADP